MFGLFYGPVQAGTQVTNYTEMAYKERRLSPGYSLTQYNANVDYPNIWTPNSTLLQGGDTTILFYSVGGVGVTKPSTDPIFATQDASASETTYMPLNVVAPIVCDTKYVLCPGNGRNCSDSGGMTNVVSWLIGKEGDSWNQLGLLFNAALGSPSVYRASLGLNAVAASETAFGGILQLDPTNATARRELTRLSVAGMLMLAGYPQLSAVGYWDVGNGTTGLLLIHCAAMSSWNRQT